MRGVHYALLALALAAGSINPAARTSAQDAPAPAASQQDANKAEQAAASEAADKSAIAGPSQVKLGTQGAIDLPEGLAFVPRDEAARLLKSYGNSASESLLGVLLPQSANSPWWATIEFIAAGYVKDDDAKTWNADELLHNIQEATLSGNDDRKDRGFPPLEVTGWVEPPRYDEDTHRLVWSALVTNIGDDGSRGSVNYNTYVLGREGYFSLDLITNKSGIEATKAAAAQLLSAIAFEKGKSYADFDASSDHIAEYGIAALVGGLALKKLGLFAIGAAFVLKFAKVIGLAAVVGGVALRKIFSRSKPS